MNKVEEKIRALEQLVDERERKLNRKIKTTIVIYAVLVVVVAAYTTIIVPKFKEETSPEKLHEIARGTIGEHITELRIRAADHIREHSADWASLAVRRSIEMIPQLEDPILQLSDDLNDYIAEHIEHVLIPSFTNALKEHAEEIRDRYKEFNDEEKMRGLALIFIEVFEEQMDDYLNDRFTVEVFELQKRLMDFSRTGGQMTKKQDAQRRLLINWLYIAEVGESGESPLTTYLESLGGQVQALISSDDVQVLDAAGEPAELNIEVVPAATTEPEADESLDEVGHPEEL